MESAPPAAPVPAAAPEPRPAIDLSPAALIAFVLDQWRDNPICRRLWRKISRYVLVLILLNALTILFNIFAQMANVPGGALPLGSMFVALGGMCLLTLLLFLLWIGVPIYYTHWAYRRTYAEDEVLRTAPVPRRDRFGGILVPLLMGLLVYALLDFLAAPLMAIVGIIQSREAGMPTTAGPVSYALAIATAITATLCQKVGNAMLYATVVLRVLLLDTLTGGRTGRRGFSVALPFLIYIGCFVGWGILRSIPSLAHVFLSIPALTAGGSPSVVFDELAWTAIYLFTILVDLLGIVVFYFVMRLFWRSDVPLAQAVLFDAPR